MTEIRTVLCPVDFTSDSERELELATRICRCFGARLVLEHNLEPRPPSYLTISWMWSEEFEGREEDKPAVAEKRLRELLDELSAVVECEARLTRGPIDNSLLYLARELPADLIVMASHGRSTPEHRSLTERIVEKAPCPVLTAGSEGGLSDNLLGDAAAGARARVVLPVELSRRDSPVLEYAEGLAGSVPLRLELVRVQPESEPERREKATREALSRLEEMTPPSLAGLVGHHVAFGEPAECILRLAGDMEADLILLGAHRKRLLSRKPQAVDFEVLHASRCPVWFVNAHSKKRGRSVERGGAGEDPPGD